MAGLLNYASSPFVVLTANSRLPGYGAVATLTNVPFDRWIYRVILNTTLVSSDITPTDWDGSNKTAICWVMLGGLADTNAILDATFLGDQNVSEYTVPILIPQKTDLYVRWPEVKTASATKCQAVLTLVTA